MLQKAIAEPAIEPHFYRTPDEASTDAGRQLGDDTVATSLGSKHATRIDVRKRIQSYAASLHK